MNLLLDKPPTSVIVEDIEYPVNWNARTMIEISILIENSPISSTDEEHAARLAIRQLELFYPKAPSNLQEAMIATNKISYHGTAETPTLIVIKNMNDFPVSNISITAVQKKQQ